MYKMQPKSVDNLIGGGVYYQLTKIILITYIGGL